MIRLLFICFIFPLIVSCSGDQKPDAHHTDNRAVKSESHIYQIQDGTVVFLYKVQKEIALEAAGMDSADIREIVMDRLYQPNEQLFSYCLGYNPDVFADSYTRVFLTKSDQMIESTQFFESNHLQQRILSTMQEIADVSPYPFEGRYTIGFFENAGCIMCGCDNFTMLGNIYHEAYRDSARLKVVLAHEINHNFFETAKQDDPDKHTVLYNSIDEGFANFFSMQVLNIGKLEAFNMSEGEYQWLLDHEQELMESFCEVRLSTREEDWDPYSERIPDRIIEGSPGDVGYFIGFRIIQSWLGRDDTRDWQMVYSTPVQSILEQSGYCK